MGTRHVWHCFVFVVSLVAMFTADWRSNAHADPIGGESPCLSCSDTASADSTTATAPSHYLTAGSSSLSLTEGNVIETVPIATVRSSAGPTIDLQFVYNSYLADSSQGGVTTTLGRGWTHSFNVLLFEYQRNVFRLSATGRAEKYKYAGGVNFTSPPGHYDRLTRTSSTVLTLRTKEGSEYRFERISPAPPYSVQGILYVLTRITDRNGNQTVLTYTNGLLTKIQDTWGRFMTLAYNANKRISTVTDPLGRVTTIQYEGTGATRLSRITDPDGKVTRYTYNAAMQITSKVDKNGRTYTYLYNAGKPYAIRDNAGSNHFNLTNANNWAINQQELLKNQEREYIPGTTVQTDGNGNVWRHTYNEDGYLTSVQTPDSFTTTYTYDSASHRVETITDPLGHVTSYEYDSRGNVTQVTDALSHVTTFTYDPVYSRRTSMTDSNGHITSYTYDANGNRTSETDANGNSSVWTYNSDGNIITETDRNGNVTTYTYDAVGNLITKEDPHGFETHYTYDAVGNTKTETDPLGHTHTYTYDGMNRVTQTTNPALDTSLQSYDGNGNITQRTDYNGNATTYQYDIRNRLIQTMDALGHTTQMTYDGNDNLLTMTNENGHVMTYQYDAQNRLTRMTDPTLAVTQYSYDNANNLTMVTNPNGFTTTYVYDALNRRTQTIDPPGGGTTTLEYDDPGGGGCCGASSQEVVTKRTDANGNVTFYQYDSLYRLTTEIRKEESTDPAPNKNDPVADATDAVTMFTYDPNGNRLTMTDPAGLTTSYMYDGLNRLVTTTNNASETTTYAYDAASNTIGIENPGGNTTFYTYDSRNYLIAATDLEGPIVTYTYDGVGNVLSQTDANGNVTTFTYDDRYRPTVAFDSLGQPTAYTYDPVGNRTSDTDRESRTTVYTYDAMNRRTSSVDALGNTTTYTYDPIGNTVSLTDANGNATQYQYDALNRPVRETYSDSEFRTFTYDAVGNLVTQTDELLQTLTYHYNDLYYLVTRVFPASADDEFVYDPAGRPLTATRDTWLVTFEYDPASGRLAETAQNGQTIQYAYDTLGRSREITYPSGRVIGEQRDLRERLEAVSDLALPPPSIGVYTYDAGDRVTTRTYSNGAVAAYGYNDNNWTTSIDHTVGATDIARFSYSYDHEGNALVREDMRDATQSETYMYDAVHRLVDYKCGTLSGSTIPAPSTDVQYDLDPVGNWDVLTVNAVPEARTHNAVNEITSIGGSAVVYDAAGLLVEDALHIYEYDEAHRLVRAQRKGDGVAVEYQYDALGRRVTKVIDPDGTPVEIGYYYDDHRAIEEQDSAATPLATYVYGRYIDEPLTMDRGGQTYYYHQNNVWSTAALTDSGGAVVERYVYDPYGFPVITDGAGVAVPDNAWGVPHSTIGNPYLFTGREFDEQTGLYDYRARVYDCMKGRFLQRDALGYIDGANLYEYAKSNPVKYVDANGEYSVAIPATKGRNQVTKSEFKWLIKRLDWSRWGQWGGTWYGPLPGRATLRYKGTLDNTEKAWANIGLHGNVDPNNAKKFDSVQLSPFVTGGTSGGSSWTNSNYNWTVQKTNIKSQPSKEKNGEECHIMTGNVSFIDGNAVTTSSEFAITGKLAAGGDKGAPGAEVSAGFTYSETVTVNVTRTNYSASFRQKICPCGAANSDLFDFRKFGPRTEKWGNSYPWYHEIEVRVENSEQNKPVSSAGMW